MVVVGGCIVIVVEIVFGWCFCCFCCVVSYCFGSSRFCFEYNGLIGHCTHCNMISENTTLFTWSGIRNKMEFCCGDGIICVSGLGWCWCCNCCDHHVRNCCGC